MILRLTVRNLYSFNEETGISFEAGKSKLLEEQVCRAKKRDDISVLKAGLIYGANASGKSNVIKAVALIREIALNLPKRYFEPFKLTAPNNDPSMVELEFKVGDKYYAYGVEFTKKGIEEEWLYKINSRSDKEIFSRKVINKTNVITVDRVSMNSKTMQLVEFIGLSTPTNVSFLAEYVKRNGRGLDDIEEVHAWMKNGLRVIFPSSKYEGISIRIEKDKLFAQVTRSLLKYFNTGIVDIKRVKISKEELDLPKGMVDKIIADAEPGWNLLIASSEGDALYFIEISKSGIISYYKQCTIHLRDDGEKVLFEMSEESDGSLRLLDFIPMLIDLTLNNSVYLIDEIDRSMHPLLSKEIIEYYLKKLSPKLNTQLIFSTHESYLLDTSFIRSDEVWFIEKGNDGASHLTSLAEYKPREDVRKGYLQGRYGAIPFFAPIKNIKC